MRDDLLEKLTPLQRRIAMCVCVGARNAEIAHTLGLKVPTVKNQVSAIFRRLDVRSRAQLVAVLLAAA